LWPDSTAAQGQPALARIVTVQGDAFEAALANFKERGVPRLAGMQGIRAIYVVSDAENRRYRIITFWESAEAAQQAYEGMAAMRQSVQYAGMSFELEDYRVEAAETL
jgi:heme-degrading monooxygenase HmoA